MSSYYYAIYFGAVLTVIAQLLMKKASFRKDNYKSKFSSILNPFTISAYFILTIVTFLTFYGLKKVDLLFMILVQPVIMILVLICSSLFFREKLGMKKILGSIIIIIGVILFNI